MTITSTVDTEEEQTVPAGVFPTLKVSQHVVMDLRVETRGLALPMAMTFASTQWYARNIGVVRSVASGELGDTVVELVEFLP